MSNCPLCRAPIKTTSSSERTVTCFDGHEVNVKSVLPGVLPVLPGWVCWQTRSNSGISEVRYDFWGSATTANYKANEADLGQDLIDRYETWMNHAYHGAGIEWELDCAVPVGRLCMELSLLASKVLRAQEKHSVITKQLEQFYPAHQLDTDNATS